MTKPKKEGENGNMTEPKTLKHIRQKNGNNYTSPATGVPLYTERDIMDWLQQKRKSKAKENRPDNIDDEYRWAQSNLLDELLDELKEKTE